MVQLRIRKTISFGVLFQVVPILRLHLSVFDSNQRHFSLYFLIRVRTFIFKPTSDFELLDFNRVHRHVVEQKLVLNCVVQVGIITFMVYIAEDSRNTRKLLFDDFIVCVNDIRALANVCSPAQSLRNVDWHKIRYDNLPLDIVHS